ncbi:hypothetical protein Tco_1247700 [Tanacetum coccineum]
MSQLQPTDPAKPKKDPEDDIEERISRWESKRIRRFNVYARYCVEHWKNLWAKQAHIRRQKQLRDKPEEVYSESKIVELGMECYQQKINLTAPTITFPGIKRKKLFSITSQPNKDVKYGYADPSPSDTDAEHLQFYEEDIEDRLKHRDQMRRWKCTKAPSPTEKNDPAVPPTPITPNVNVVHGGVVAVDPRIQQAKNQAIAQAQQDGTKGNFRIFDSPFGNFMVPVVPTRAELRG